MNFKPLPEELTNHGYKMKMVKRTDLVAMYSKCGGFEVVAVQRVVADHRACGGGGGAEGQDVVGRDPREGAGGVGEVIIQWVE